MARPTNYRDFPSVAELVSSSLPRTSGQRADLKFREQVRAIHACGSRPVAELLLELRERLACNAWFDARLERYASMDPVAVAACGAADLPMRATVMVIDGGKGRAA
jgi:hypothetical protein